MFSYEKLCLSKARPGKTPGSLSVHWTGAVDFQRENNLKRNPQYSTQRLHKETEMPLDLRILAKLKVLLNAARIICKKKAT